MYRGDFNGSRKMLDVHPDAHASWKGMNKPAFVARFKYGYKPWKAWVNFLVKNATVEKYMELAIMVLSTSTKGTVMKLVVHQLQQWNNLVIRGRV